MITSPSDERRTTNRSAPRQIVKGRVAVQARAWGSGIDTIILSIDDGDAEELQPLEDCMWSKSRDSSSHPDGSHLLTVTATASDGKVAKDRITVRVHQRGVYRAPGRHQVDYENALGEWPDKHILGTQLGPNENGSQWSSRRECAGR